MQGATNAKCSVSPDYSHVAMRCCESSIVGPCEPGKFARKMTSLPVRVTRRVPYTVTRRVARQVSRQIEVTCTKMVPRYVERQVPCTTRELVPVVVE